MDKWEEHICQKASFRKAKHIDRPRPDKCALDKVQYAILETDGHVNVIMNPQDSPATAGQMGKTPEDVGYPHIVVSKGKIAEENMTLLGLDRQWLDERIRENGKNDISEVYLMTVTDKKKIQIYKEDN